MSEASYVPSTSRPASSRDQLALGWLAEQIHESVEPGQTIHRVLLQGRDLLPERVLRVRSTHRGAMLLPELRWEGPDTSVAEQLQHLAAAQHELLDQNGDAAREARFRIRLQVMNLESTLLAYAATELVDPQVMDAQLSLDVLAYETHEMPPMVITKLGLARAHREERGSVIVLDPSIADRAWQAEMHEAAMHADSWAHDLLQRARSAPTAKYKLHG